MCHVNLDLDAALHKEIFRWKKNVNSRILTLSQGQLSVTFPPGFGMPIMSNEPLLLTTQVLNHNIENPNLEVRHRVTFEYARDRELATPMTPLFNSGIYGMALIEGRDGIFGKAADDTADHGNSCLMRPQAPNAMSGSLYKDGEGRTFTGHWIVRPGREVNHTNVTRLLDIPFDTTLHYAAVHLHPFAESLELRDLTTNQSIFRSIAKGPRGKVGLTRVTSFSSSEGVTLHKDHEYELISVYNNTTKKDQDSMAVMYLSPLDREFVKPDPKAAARIVASRTPDNVSAAPVGQEENRWLILRTTAGDLGFELLPDAAPATVRQFATLVRAGVFDTVRFSRLEPGFLLQAALAEDRRTALQTVQRSLIRPIPLELTGISHERGVLAMARRDDDPNSAETSFYILLGKAPHLDGKYTTFGTLRVGGEVLAELEKVPVRPGSTEPAVRIEIVKAEMIRTGEPLTLAAAKPVVAPEK
jgi:cyclophilin family peptidyl-prolyl cis-trans isomerase